MIRSDINPLYFLFDRLIIPLLFEKEGTKVLLSVDVEQKPTLEPSRSGMAKPVYRQVKINKACAV
jgi:hypothetical protein